LSSKAKRAGDSKDYSNPNNFMGQKINIAAEDVGKWITYTYTVTITEEMLPTLVNGSATQYAGVSLLGLYFRGFDGNRDPNSDRLYSTPPVIQVDNFKSYNAGKSSTISVPVEESVSVSGVGNSTESLIVRAPEESAKTNGIQKSYVMFAPNASLENIQKATLQFKVGAAAGQTIKIFALNVDALPENMNWTNAPGNRNDTNIDLALAYGGTAIATLEAIAGKTYSVDVTDYVYAKENSKYIFVITSNEPSGCQYLNLNFNADIADMIGNATVANGVATITGADGVCVEDVFGSGESVTAGETYTVSVKVKNTTAETVTYFLAPVYADGTKGSAVSQSIAAGQSKILTLSFTATAQDVQNGLNAIAIYGGDCQIDDLSVRGTAPITLPTDGMKLCVETAKNVACQHQWDDGVQTIAPTCTQTGSVTYTCSACSETYTETLPATGEHTYVDGSCSVCGEADPNAPTGPIEDANLKFAGGTGISFQDYIGLNAPIRNKLIGNYDRVYALAEQVTPDGKVITTECRFVLYNSTYTFVEHPVMAWSMTENVTITLYAEKDGKTYVGASIETSVAKLALEKLAANETAGNVQVCEILANMLKYGKKLQEDMNHYADSLPEAGEYEKYATTEDPELTEETITSGTGTAYFKNPGMSMQDKVEFNITCKVQDLEGRTVKVLVNGEVVEGVEATFTPYNSTYTYARVAVAAYRMRDVFTIAIYDDVTGEAVSVIYETSIAAMAKQRLSTAYKDLVLAIMRYGDSVAEYYKSTQNG
jgi:hypothetical protein